MKQEIYITTDAAVFARAEGEIHVLLIQRKNEPFKNQWALPGGFVEENEKLINACKRELEEETGLFVDISEFQFIDIFDDVRRDPRNRTITAAYAIMLDELNFVEGRDDAANARWVKLNQIHELAFDHLLILEKAKSILNIV
jgi:8-oxo-dGTP diphosphatase